MQIGIGNHFVNTSAGIYGKKNCELCYVPIYKNAHTWGEKFFAETYGWENIEFLYYKNPLQYKNIVFLRDPLERWYSGVTQFLCDFFYKNISNDQEIVIDKQTLELIFNVVRFDIHTDHQRRFIMNLELFDTYFFNIDKPNFYVNLTKFLNKVSERYKMEKQNNTILNYSNPIHVSSDDARKVSLINQIKHYGQKNEDKLANVVFYYKTDYELLKYAEELRRENI
jgi:hypothetical protein